MTRPVGDACLDAPRASVRGGLDALLQVVRQPLRAMTKLAALTSGTGRGQLPGPAASPLTGLAPPAGSLPFPSYHPAIDALVEALPAGEFAWHDVPSTLCLGGTSTGFAISEAPRSRTLALAFEGGGACNSAATCFGPVADLIGLKSSYNETTFLTDRIERSYWNTPVLAHRDQPDSPLYNATVVFTPYCTGDLFAGHSIMRYPRRITPAYHVGSDNVRVMLNVLHDRYPNTEHLVVIGASAGGFGAMLNFPTIRAVFDRPRIDLLDDSGFAPRGIAQAASWGIDLSATCDACDDDFPRYVTTLLGAHPQSRFGFTGYLHDTVLPLFFAVFANASAPLEDYAAAVHEQFAAYDESPNTRTFLANASGHAMLLKADTRIEDTTLTHWMRAMFSGDDTHWRTLAN